RASHWSPVHKRERGHGFDKGEPAVITDRGCLFVCAETANRSKRAGGSARLYGGERVEAFSAGSRPSGVINPKAIEAMRELGYDLSAHGSKSLDELPAVEFDFVATMGCGDACPSVAAKRRGGGGGAAPAGVCAAPARGGGGG